MQNVEMPKDKTFKLRLDQSDREHLDFIAQRYSAPAATVIRMLIAEKFHALALGALPTLATQVASARTRRSRGKKK